MGNRLPAKAGDVVLFMGGQVMLRGQSDSDFALLCLCWCCCAVPWLWLCLCCACCPASVLLITLTIGQSSPHEDSHEGCLDA